MNDGENVIKSVEAGGGVRNPRAASDMNKALEIFIQILETHLLPTACGAVMTRRSLARQSSRLTYPDAVHGAHLGAHGHDKRPVAAERTTGAFVEFTGQRAHEARETEVRVQTYIPVHTS